MSWSPEINISGDHHIHTRFCNHASGEMEEYILAAVQKGLTSMTFLEHLECNITYDHRTWLTPELFTEYFLEGQRLQKQYSNRIHIRLGVEVGYNPEAIPQLQKMLLKFPFEHIGLSYHFIRNGSTHLNIVSRRTENILSIRRAGPERILTKYFKGLIKACTELPCDKLCHLDAALRHVSDICLTRHHLVLINKLLLIMRHRNIALEINTSGFAIRSTPYPSSKIINQAIKLEIPLIIGSDAHKPEQVARCFGLLDNYLP